MKISKRKNADGDVVGLGLVAETDADRRTLRVVLSDLGGGGVTVPEPDRVVVRGSSDTAARAAVLMYLRGLEGRAASCSTIAAELKLHRNTVRARVYELIARGVVAHVADDGFRACDDEPPAAAPPAKRPASIGRPRQANFSQVFGRGARPNG